MLLPKSPPVVPAGFAAVLPKSPPDELVFPNNPPLAVLVVVDVFPNNPPLLACVVELPKSPPLDAVVVADEPKLNPPPVDEVAVAAGFEPNKLPPLLLALPNVNVIV